MISSIQQRIFFSLYLQSKPWLADKMQQQSMDGPLKDYHVLMHLFGENNVLNCCLFSNKSIWNYLCSWGRTGDKMNTDYTCFTSELKAHPECKSFTNSSQNQQGSVVWKRLQSQNSSPSHIHTNTLISSNSSSPPYQERSSLLQPDMHRCSGKQQDPARTQSAALCPSLQEAGKVVFNTLQIWDDRVVRMRQPGYSAFNSVQHSLTSDWVVSISCFRKNKYNIWLTFPKGCQRLQ